MLLQPVPSFHTIEPDEFREKFYLPQKPVVIKDLAKKWPAYTKWNWSFFKQRIGEQRVALYNNIKSDAYTPINSADDYKTFAEYIDMINAGPSGWRIFLFNILNMRLNL